MARLFQTTSVSKNSNSAGCKDEEEGKEGTGFDVTIVHQK